MADIIKTISGAFTSGTNDGIKQVAGGGKTSVVSASLSVLNDVKDYALKKAIDLNLAGKISKYTPIGSAASVGGHIYRAYQAGDVSKLATGSFAADVAALGTDVTLGPAGAIARRTALATGGAIFDLATDSKARETAVATLGSAAQTTKEYASYVAEQAIATVDAGAKLVSDTKKQVSSAAHAKFVEPIADAVKAATPTMRM